MSKTSVVSSKFSSLEIVDSAKFDNEIVFEDLVMEGTNLEILCSENITISSAGDTTPDWGVDVLAVGPITVSSAANTTYILGGYTDGVTPVSGSVRIGHSTSTTPATAFQVSWDSGTTSNRIGAFGVTPVIRPTTAAAEPAFVVGAGTAVNITSTFGGYTVGQVVTALQALGFLT